jgi:DNA-binding LacI/PurR family transcriptional regulator
VDFETTIAKETRRSPTIGDVARLAGVSQTTVSFVLNDVSGRAISERTRTRVRASAHELRYRPNAAAKLLRTNRSHTIGFITATRSLRPRSPGTSSRARRRRPGRPARF